MGELVENAGQCLCGDVKITTYGEPKWISHCHCPSCQKATGAAFATFAGFAASAIMISGENYNRFSSSPGVRRGFCRNCGSSVSFEGEAWPEEVHIFVSLMDNASELMPERHVYARTKRPWVKLSDGLPVLDGFGHD